MPHCDFRESVYMKSVCIETLFFLYKLFTVILQYCTCKNVCILWNDPYKCFACTCSCILLSVFNNVALIYTLFRVQLFGWLCFCDIRLSRSYGPFYSQYMDWGTSVHIIMACHYKKFDHMRMFIVPRFCQISYTPLFIYMELYMYKASFQLRFWFILISFQKLFLGCSLSGLAAYPPVFTVHVRVQWTCHTLNLN